jgi:hypothetical protein
MVRTTVQGFHPEASEWTLTLENDGEPQPTADTLDTVCVRPPSRAKASTREGFNRNIFKKAHYFWKKKRILIPGVTLNSSAWWSPILQTGDLPMDA